MQPHRHTRQSQSAPLASPRSDPERVLRHASDRVPSLGARSDRAASQHDTQDNPRDSDQGPFDSTQLAAAVADMTLHSPTPSLHAHDGHRGADGTAHDNAEARTPSPGQRQDRVMTPLQATPPTSPFAQLGDALAEQVMPLLRVELSEMETRLTQRIDDMEHAWERRFEDLRLENAEAIRRGMVTAQVTDVLTNHVRTVLSGEEFYTALATRVSDTLRNDPTFCPDLTERRTMPSPPSSILSGAPSSAPHSAASVPQQHGAVGPPAQPPSATHVAQAPAMDATTALGPPVAPVLPKTEPAAVATAVAPTPAPKDDPPDDSSSSSDTSSRASSEEDKSKKKKKKKKKSETPKAEPVPTPAAHAPTPEAVHATVAPMMAGPAMAQHSPEDLFPGVTPVTTVHAAFAYALDYRTYRLFIRDQEVEEAPDKSVRRHIDRVNNRVKGHKFDPDQPISILRFAKAFAGACDDFGYSEGLALRILPQCIEGPPHDALTSRVRSSYGRIRKYEVMPLAVVGSLPDSRTSLTSYCAAMHFLLQTYATDEHIAAFEESLAQLRHVPGRVNPEKFATQLWNRVNLAGCVYNEFMVVGLFMKGLHSSIGRRVRSYWSHYPGSSLQRLACEARTLEAATPTAAPAPPPVPRSPTPAEAAHTSRLTVRDVLTVSSATEPLRLSDVDAFVHEVSRLDDPTIINVGPVCRVCLAPRDDHVTSECPHIRDKLALVRARIAHLSMLRRPTQPTPQPPPTNETETPGDDETPEKRTPRGGRGGRGGRRRTRGGKDPSKDQDKPDDSESKN